MLTKVEENIRRSELETYFKPFRDNIIGIDQEFESPFGMKRIVYADWTASGRLYRPIEEKMLKDFGPFVANTHTETTESGTAMTLAYHEAKKIIKDHLNCDENDVLIVSGTGMTGVVNKFQRILGLKIPENLKEHTKVPEEKRPVVFITHMEHHSNQTSWLETMCDVEVIPPGPQGLFKIENLEKLLKKYEDRPLKIASVTGGSNVTGLQVHCHEVARLMHENGGICFVDYACAGPYINIDMHPEHKDCQLDAVFLSPHKFLGGPGTCGILAFNKKLYHNMIPDNPGGGTVSWTNPWGEHKYIDDIEDREDGGTPGFLQTIKTALAIKLKEQMGVEKMLEREHEILAQIFMQLSDVPGLNILAPQHQDRLGVISFYIDDLHYNLGVKLLNDRFGIQTRGGCSCAGTYGHYLLHVDYELSHELTKEISLGDLARKPGWIRMSIHPTTSCEEVDLICDAIKGLAANHEEWAKDYNYDSKTNEFIHGSVDPAQKKQRIKNWFNL